MRDPVKPSYEGVNHLAVTTGELWARIEQLATSTRDCNALRRHGVELIAARAWRRHGQPVPDELYGDWRRAALIGLAVRPLVEHVRSVCDGALMLMKGPEVAARYPEPTLRPFGDLDFLAEDPETAHRALITAGFVALRDSIHPEDHQHLAPLVSPSLPLVVELHRAVHLPVGLSGPSPVELFELAQPSATGVTGVLAPVPAAHAVLLAAHGWAHEPLRRLLDLIDLALVLSDENRAYSEQLARRWGLERIWHTSIGAADALLRGARRGLPLRTWAAHLNTLRERTVLETHSTRWAGQVWGFPQPRLRALGSATATFALPARPREGEGWGSALRRTSWAIAHALDPQSEHEMVKESWRKR